MTKDDIAQKLKLLPEGVAEINLQSWRKAISYYEKGLDNWEHEYYPSFDDIHKIASAFSMSEQAKLFRVDESAADLKISTSDEQALRNGDPYVIVFFTGGTLVAEYRLYDPRTIIVLKKIPGGIYAAGDKAITFFQHLLDILWNETRGKKKE